MALYLELPGTTGHYVSTPDHADFDITDELEIRARLALDDWGGNTVEAILGQDGGGSNISYRMYITETAGVAFLAITWWEGAIQHIFASTPSDPITALDGQAWWLRSRVISTGTDTDIFLEESATEGPWTLLEAPSVGHDTSPYRASTAEVAGGARSATLWNMDGNLYQIKVLDTGVLAAHFNAADFDLGDSDGATAVDATGKTWTIHGAGSEIKDDGLDNPHLMLLGVG